MLSLHSDSKVFRNHPAWNKAKTPIRTCLFFPLTYFPATQNIQGKVVVAKGAAEGCWVVYRSSFSNHRSDSPSDLFPRPTRQLVFLWVISFPIVKRDVQWHSESTRCHMFWDAKCFLWESWLLFRRLNPSEICAMRFKGPHCPGEGVRDGAKCIREGSLLVHPLT